MNTNLFNIELLLMSVNIHTYFSSMAMSSKFGNEKQVISMY